jgi:hypothetical protein
MQSKNRIILSNEVTVKNSAENFEKIRFFTVSTGKSFTDLMLYIIAFK